MVADVTDTDDSMDYSAMEDLSPEYGGRVDNEKEIDPRLVELLDRAMDEWGSQGVMRTAREVVERRALRVRTDNDFLLAGHNGALVFMLQTVIHTRQEAFRTAAWLICMGETLPNEVPASEFEEVFEAVRNT